MEAIFWGGFKYNFMETIFNIILFRTAYVHTYTNEWVYG